MEASQYVNKALEYEGDLSVMDFIEYVKYPIEPFIVDRFWHTMRQKRYLYVDAGLIEWMGYSNIDARMRKRDFMGLLQNTLKLELGNDYLYLSNDEYETYLNKTVCVITHTELYPPIDHSNGKNTTKHLLLTPKCLRLAMMSVNTNKGQAIRLYYLALEDLFSVYADYRTAYIARAKREPVVPGDGQLVVSQRELADLRKRNEELAASIRRITAFNEEITQRDRHLNKLEVLYVATTYTYAQEGLYGLFHTKNNIRARMVTQNTSHTTGDRFVVLHEVKCGDSKALKGYAKYILKCFTHVPTREFFKIPFNLLVRILDRLDEDTDDLCQLANECKDIYDRCRLTCDTIDWMEGVPMQRFALPASSEPLAITSSEHVAEPTPIDSNVAVTPTPIIPLIVENATVENTTVDDADIDALLALIALDDVPPLQPAITVLPPQSIPAITVPLPQLPPIPQQPPVVVAQFTFTVGTLTPAQTEAFIAKGLPGYLKSLTSRQGPTWSSFKRYFTRLCKSEHGVKQPKIDNGKDQLKRLCVKYEVIIK